MAHHGPGTELQIRASGEVLEALEALRQISGVHDLYDLIMRACYLYREILAEQALGATIFADTPRGRESLVGLVKDKELALEFVADAKPFSFQRDWHLFFVPRDPEVS